MPALLFLEGYISAFWDHNLELTIGFQRLGPVAWGMRWGWEWGFHKAPLPHPTPGTSDPVCLGLILQPVTPSLSLCMCACTHLFFLSSLLGGVVTGRSCYHVQLVALEVYLTLPMDFLSYGRHPPCTQGPTTLCTSAVVCFPSSPCGGGIRVWVWQL
jgi:hypothetical protein